MSIDDQKHPEINKNIEKQKKIKIWNFFFDQIKPFKFYIFLHIVSLFFFGVYTTIFPKIISQMIDNSTDYWRSLLDIIVISAAATIGFRIYHYSYWYYTLPKLQENMNKHILYSIMSHDHNYYQDNLTGDLSNKRTDIIEYIPSLYLAITEGFILPAILIFFTLSNLHTLPLKYSIAVFLWITSFIIGSIYVGKKLSHLSQECASSDTKLTGLTADIITNMTSVKLFNRKSFEIVNFDNYNIENRKLKQKLELIYFILFSGYSLLFTTIITYSLWSMSYDYENKMITIGEIALFIQLTTILVSYLWKVTEQIQRYILSIGKIKEAYFVLMQKGILTKKANQKLQVSKGVINFNNITFSYKADQKLFKNLSVIINAGEKVGLVGYSGGGKSTFVNLILSLYSPQSGKIMIDDQDLMKVTSESINEAIAMIPQDPSLFNRTIYENIAYGNPQASYDEVVHAAKQAQAHDFIMTFDDQYNSMVGEKGSKLSGGQRQRIIIARALLKNAKIMILDEITSQLDSINEEKIQQELFKLMGNRTTLIIAHRLSTLKHVDRLLIFDKGVIVGDGKHEDLIKTNNLYKELWNKQLGA